MTLASRPRPRSLTGWALALVDSCDLAVRAALVVVRVLMLGAGSLTDDLVRVLGGDIRLLSTHTPGLLL